MDLYLDKNLILDSNCGFKEARFGILGVPFDSTCSYRPGTRFGPLWIRKEFLELEKPEGFFRIKVFDLGNIDVVHGNLVETNKRIEETLKKAFENNPRFIPVLLGGEHSLSYPVIKVLSKRFKDLQVAHFDAHADLKDGYLGEKWSHATVMKRVYDLGVDIVQLGVRAADGDEKKIQARLKKKLEDKPTYISIDMDVMDPGLCPGVGTPEPGGFTLPELLTALGKIKNVVGFDIVETNPLFDKGDVTSITAARIMFELVQR
jgi:agmatinase